MKIHLTSIFLLITMATGSAFAAGTANIPDYRRVDTRAGTTLHGATLGTAKADSLVVYGGLGTLEGKFEVGGGGPDWGGWTSVDNTAQATKWNIDTYNCANIGGGGAGNHAWWCGEVFEDACGGSPEGYGNGWEQYLDWSAVVANAEAATEVCVTWDMNWDTEEDFDQLRLVYDHGTGYYEEMGLWEGVGTALDITVCFTVDAGSYTGDNEDKIVLRFEFISDGGWSDEDCLHTTDGACQLDDIEVRFDGALQGTVEDCEGKAPAQWICTVEQSVGDFAALWTNLNDADDCRSNSSAVVAFIDNGQLEGLDGSMCISFCYGPGGYVVNTSGGLAGAGNHLDNCVVSPKIPWPAGYEGALLEYDVYTHLDLASSISSGVYYYWNVRGTADPLGETGWSQWKSHDFISSGGPAWRRDKRLCSSLLCDDPRWVQCRLGVSEIFWIWPDYGNDATPAPYFDNIKWTAFAPTGPEITALEIELAQDNFPTNDGIDTVTLENNSIRFDMAMDIAVDGHHVNDPGDSVIVTAAAVRAGSYLDYVPQMHWRMKANPVFDGVRTLPAGATQVGNRIFGAVDADTVFTRDGIPRTPIADRWAFDLPDEGFFYPGDQIHYYIRATDMVDGVGQGVSILPADTSGYDDFRSILSYDPSFVVRGLPSVFDDGTKALTHPAILFWNDFADRSADNEWYWAMHDIGLSYGWDYDVYYTNTPTAGVGNGLGGRAGVDHIDGYESIFYSAGDLSHHTITNIDWDGDKGDDIGLLEDWLALGDKNMALFGDDILYDLDRTPQGRAFTSDRLGLSLADRDLNPMIDYQTAPTVHAVPGDPIFSTGIQPFTDWIAYGGCLGLNTFDAVIPTTAQQLAYFADLNGEDTYPYSAASLNVYNPFSTELDPLTDNRLIHFPYDFSFIYTPSKAPVPSAARTKIFEKLMLYFGSLSPVAITSVPERETFAVENFPNPFNPSTKLAWSIPARAAMTIEIFNVRGMLVRRLIDDEMVDAVGDRSWNGRDDAGAQVASGVYFAKIRSGDYEKTLKLALVK